MYYPPGISTCEGNKSSLGVLLAKRKNQRVQYPRLNNVKPTELHSIDNSRYRIPLFRILWKWKCRILCSWWNRISRKTPVFASCFYVSRWRSSIMHSWSNLLLIVEIAMNSQGYFALRIKFIVKTFHVWHFPQTLIFPQKYSLCTKIILLCTKELFFYVLYKFLFYHIQVHLIQLYECIKLRSVNKKL